MSDIITPVKHRMSGYRAIEDAIEAAILECFGLSDLTEGEHAMMKDIDTAMFANDGTIEILATSSSDSA